MDKLFEFISKYYSPPEYPALAAQWRRWEKSKPLASAKILDATPVFRNTLVKYAALLAGGADLTITVGKNIPCDPAILEIVPEFGIKVASPEELALSTWDVVADCAGSARCAGSKYGNVELTRSGLEYYKNWKKPVFSADSGVLKKLETILGTGEGFLRAMKQSGFTDFKGKNILVFGGGKVGTGVARYAASAGACVTVADLQPISLPEHIKFLNASHPQSVREAIAGAWCIVSVTGIAGALSQWCDDLAASCAIIANMGVEDEFGTSLPSSRVLNHKSPLNFILEEPTHLKYIDATMALNNYGIVKLLSSDLPAGINFPERKLEKSIVDDIKNGGLIASEMSFITDELA